MRSWTVVAVAMAALAGYAVGTWSAPARSRPLATPAVAWIPTSTPDLRAPILVSAATAGQSAAPAAATRSPLPSTHVPSPSPEPPHVAQIPSSGSAPTPRPAPQNPDVLYLARPNSTPLAVTVPGAADGRSASDRIYSRLRALPKAHAPAGAVNVAARSFASLAAVTVEGDGSVVLEYALVGGTWGFGSQEDLRLLMQQIVFTATEEKDVHFVTLRRYGGGPVPVRPAEQWTFGLQMSRDDLLNWLR